MKDWELDYGSTTGFICSTEAIEDEEKTEKFFLKLFPSNRLFLEVNHTVLHFPSETHGLLSQGFPNTNTITAPQISNMNFKMHSSFGNYTF